MGAHGEEEVIMSIRVAGVVRENGGRGPIPDTVCNFEVSGGRFADAQQVRTFVAACIVARLQAESSYETVLSDLTITAIRIVRAKFCAWRSTFVLNRPTFSLRNCPSRLGPESSLRSRCVRP